MNLRPATLSNNNIYAFIHINFIYTASTTGVCNYYTGTPCSLPLALRNAKFHALK